MASEVTRTLGQLSRIEHALNDLHKKREMPMHQAAELIGVTQARKEMVQCVRQYHNEALESGQTPELVRRALDEANHFIIFAQKHGIINEEGAA